MTSQESFPLMARNILAPSDLSQGVTSEVLPRAVSLSREFDAHLYVLYVYQLPSFLDLLTSPHALLKDREELAGEMEQLAQQQLSALLSQFAHENIQLHGLLQLGIPFEEILKAAQELPADLIIMCTRGRRGLAHLLGSTTERVVRMAACPVVTVKPSRFRFAIP